MVNWHVQNQQTVIEAMSRLRRALSEPESRAEEADTVPPTLARLSQCFGLSAFERDVLLLCAGMEFDGDWAALCARRQGNPQQLYPTFSLALKVLPHPSWQALAPTAPLRYWRLLEIGTGNALATSPLRLDERILHELAGVGSTDERLLAWVEPVVASETLVASHQQVAEAVAQVWLQSSGTSLPLVQLCGPDVTGKRAIAAAACQQVGVDLHAIAVETLPAELSQLTLMQRLCEREWTLSGMGLLLEWDWAEFRDPEREGAIARFADAVRVPTILSTPDRRSQRQRSLVTFDISAPTAEEQRALWHQALGDSTLTLNGHLDPLVSQFNLNSAQIRSACVKLNGQSVESDPASHLWDICRIQARSRLDELAQRIDSSTGWDDLILPEKERGILADIAAHVRQRTTVYERWGFAAKGQRGLGMSVLFAGASGTGKTMAAEVLANELKLDLYRIDLSSVVSKYIGETEKNLRRVFDAAEGSGAILLFDEADALFGKRSEVKDSHDRHANIEVGYLLQRMESYRGLAILTTNLKGSLDQAFLRRLRFIVQFPFPDMNQRAEIWQRVFPDRVPTQGLNYKKLAKLGVAGGNIKNIALNAAFIAADAGEAVGMKHILEAVKGEYMKLERPLTDAEVKGWV
jgi:hypothetical protein